MRTLFLALSLSPALLAQSNANPGYDINMYSLSGITDYRVGPSGSPTGTAAITFGHGWCNGGTAAVPWEDQNPDGTMTDTYPKVSFLIARELNGRMEQISNRSFVKYSYITFNLGSSVCGTCQSSPSGGWFRVGCYDAYGAGTNAAQHYLGPADEINPWLGSWDSVGGYWDAGDPPVSGAAATDNVKSLSTSGFSAVKNRPQVAESVLMEGGNFFTQVYAIIKGEPVENRWNNIMTRPASITWNGSSWDSSHTGDQVQDCVLSQWSGATHEMGGNGTDDGRFCVAVKVTGPTAGMYHYEYAVQNIDNNRQGATLRIPVSATATVSNWGVKDIDTDGSNDWTFSRVGEEITFSAGVDNALAWNTIYNFWFDCSEPPSFGIVEIDQALPGPGAGSVSVGSQVPADTDFASVDSIGQACGACDDTIYEYFSSASGFDLDNDAMSFEFDGTNYSAEAGTSSWVTPAGATHSLGLDDTVTIALPFTLPYPGGTTTSLIVCSNGFISPGAGNGTTWTPSVSGFLSGNPRWAPAWHDYNMPSSGSGQLVVDTTPTKVTVTWNGVYAFGGSGQGDTFQCQFDSSGDVHMIWQSMLADGNGYLVGWTPGGGASDPGATDVSDDLGGGVTLCASGIGALTLASSDRPVLGTTIDLTTSNIPPGTSAGASMFSFTRTNPTLDLTPFGMEGCELYGIGDGFSVPLPSLSGSAVLPFTVPSSTSLIDLELIVQSFTISPPLTSLGVIGSNGLVLTLGSL